MQFSLEMGHGGPPFSQLFPPAALVLSLCLVLRLDLVAPVCQQTSRAVSQGLQAQFAAEILVDESATNQSPALLRQLACRDSRLEAANE